MESIPDQRIKQDGNDNRSYRRNRWSGIIDPDRRCHRRQCQISDDCRILKISDDQISQRHPIQMMRAFPEARSFRSEEHTSELQSLMRTSYALFFLKQKYHTNSLNT